APSWPHMLHDGKGGLAEFPIAVTRWLRFPVYHTFAYFVSERLFRRNLQALLRSSLPVFYEFHAADLLDLHHDAVDPRMERHPGMGRLAGAQAAAAARPPRGHRGRPPRHHLPGSAGVGRMELSGNEPLVAAVVISRNEEQWIESSLRSAIAALAPFAGSKV